MKIPESNNRFLQIAREHVSFNNEVKIEKALKCFQKLCEKQHDGDYVSARDLIVFGLVAIGSVEELIEQVKTSKNGHEELEKLIKEIHGENENK